MKTAVSPSSAVMPRVVHFVGEAFAHLSGRSGYARLVDHVGNEMSVESLDGSNRRDLPSRLCSWMARRSAQEWYSSRSFRREVDATLRLIRSGHAAVHVLHAEDDLRYLGHARSIARMRRSAILATYHQPPEVLERVVDVARSAGSIDAVIALGSNQVPYFESVVERERVHLLPHGIDTEYFTPLGSQRPSSGGTCLCVGNWLRDFEMLRGVVDRVGARDPSVMFRLVVSEARAGDFEGRPNVRLLHSVSDEELLSEYRSADLLVLPYEDVVASNAVLEGLACGVPVVTTDVGAMRDYASTDCAVLVAPGDVEAMSDGILELVGDEGRRREMGMHARRTALRFDWENVARMHVELYRRAVEEAR